LAIPILIGISIITFALAKAMPGDPFSSLINPKMTAADFERMRRVVGLDDPPVVQYLKWLRQLLAGNLGNSFSHNAPVIELIGERIGITFTLGMISLIVGFGLGVPIGVLVATRQYSIWDNVGTVFAFAGISTPSFFMGLLSIRYLAFGLKWFPSQGIVTIGANLPFPYNHLDVLSHLLLPGMVLGFYSVARSMRFVRSSMLEVVRQDYIRTARSKGLGERVVIYKHALRNALIPVVTLLGLSVPFLLSGAIITEQVFRIPGMGTLSYNAVLSRDYPIVMGTTLLFALMTLVGNLLADLAYCLVDPRIRYD